jgi:hypothetical protein
MLAFGFNAETLRTRRFAEDLRTVEDESAPISEPAGSEIGAPKLEPGVA